jgi:lipopolysaccharide export system permease protein
LTLISRYILRETFFSFIVVISVLLLIFMSNQFAEILGDAAADELPRDAVFAILGLTFLRYLTLLAPIGLLLGVMLALARLNRDSEMAALVACGIGPGRLLRPISALTIALAAGVAWLALVEAPTASRSIEQIRFEATESMELSVLEPGRFLSPDSGRTVLYARAVEGETLRDVFLERERDGRVVVILAASGRRIHDPDTGELSFVLYDGRRYEGVPGEGDFTIWEFREHGIPVRKGEEEEFVEAVETRATVDLLASDDPEDRAELQAGTRCEAGRRTANSAAAGCSPRRSATRKARAQPSRRTRPAPTAPESAFAS